MQCRKTLWGKANKNTGRWEPLTVKPCGNSIFSNLLISLQLIVGLLTVMGTGLGSSNPEMKQGTVSRQHSPSGNSVEGWTNVSQVHFVLAMWENREKTVALTWIVFHQVMQGGESDSWRYVEPRVFKLRDAVVLHRIPIWRAGPPQDGEGIAV